MVVETIQPFQIMVMVLFLAAMLGVLFFVKQYGGPLRSKLHADKRIQVVQETALGNHESLRIIRVDDSEFLLLSTKGQSSTFINFKDCVQLEDDTSIPAFLTARRALDQ